jgi:hypothetical protein
VAHRGALVRVGEGVIVGIMAWLDDNGCPGAGVASFDFARNGYPRRKRGDQAALPTMLRFDISDPSAGARSGMVSS